MRPLRSISILLLFAAAIAFAAAPAEPVGPVEPTVITSDSVDMRTRGKETLSVLDGHVVVTATGLKLTCDHLEILSTAVGEKDESVVGDQDRFKSLIATGHVRIVQGDREAVCGKAVVLPREDKITLSENPVVMDHGNGAVFESDVLVLYRGDRQVHGEKVKMTFPPLRNLGFDPSQPPPAPPNTPSAGENPPASTPVPASGNSAPATAPLTVPLPQSDSKK